MAYKPQYIFSVDPGMTSAYTLMLMHRDRTFTIVEIGLIKPPKDLEGRTPHMREKRLEYMRREIVTMTRAKSKCEMIGFVEKQFLTLPGGKSQSGNPYDILALAEVAGYWTMAIDVFGKYVEKIHPRTWQAYFERPKNARKGWSVEKVDLLLRCGIINPLKIGQQLKRSHHNRADSILIGLCGGMNYGG